MIPLGKLKRVLFIAFILFALYLLYIGLGLNEVQPSQRGEVLTKELNYLNNISEIQWWEAVQNTVYISFSPVPTNWKAIIKEAGWKGNKKIDFGVHVWALDNKQIGWRPGDSNYLGNITVRYGQFE